MKKLFLTMLTILLVSTFFISGCSNDTGTSETVTVTVTETPSEEAYEWTFHQCIPATDASQRCHEKLVEMIEENTNGRIKITILPVSSVVGSTELLTACATGQVNMFAASGQWWSGTMPIAAVQAGLPFCVPQDEYLELLFDYGIEDLARQEYAKQGVYLLTDYACGVGSGEGGLILTEPIDSIDDLQGRQIRGTGILNDFLEALGATPITMAISELYTGLSTGAIEGVMSSLEPMIDQKMYEVAKYAILPSTFQTSNLHIGLNLDDWNSLSEDLQMILQLTAYEWADWEYRYYVEREYRSIDETYEILEENGVTFITLSEADQLKVLEAAREVWDDLASQDAVAAEGVQIIVDYMTEKGYPGF